MREPPEFYKSSDGIRFEANWQLLHIVQPIFDPDAIVCRKKFLPNLYLPNTNDRIREIVHRCIACL